MLETPQREVDYEYHVTFVISIEHDVGPKNNHVTQLMYVLEVLIDEVKTIVDAAYHAKLV
jgi:hypothetical protein